MSAQTINFDYRRWFGTKQTWASAARKYDFPVTIRQKGDDEPAQDRDH